MGLVAAIGFLLVIFLVYKFGALLSGELFHYFYANDEERRHSTLSPDELKNTQTIFFNTVYTLLGALAKSDGHIDEVEVDVTETYMGKMDLDKTQRQEAIRLFKQGAAAQFELQGLINGFLPLSQRNANLTEILLVYMVNLARMDGVLVDAEQKLLHQVATGLGYTSIAFDHLLRMIASQNRFVDAPPRMSGAEAASAGAKAETKQDNYEVHTNDLDAAYEALGVTTNASDAEIKKAYRRLVNQFHPDKLTGQGLPDFMVRAATEHTKKIHAAYNYIKKNRKTL